MPAPDPCHRCRPACPRVEPIPAARRRPLAALAKRRLAGALLVVSIAAGCGGSLQARGGRPLRELGLHHVEASIAAGDPAAALRHGAALEATGATSARLDALLAWAASMPLATQPTPGLMAARGALPGRLQALAARVRAGEPGAHLAAEQLLAAFVAVSRPKEALALYDALFREGCSERRADCDLALRALLALPLDAPALVARAIALVDATTPRSGIHGNTGTASATATHIARTDAGTSNSGAMQRWICGLANAAGLRGRFDAQAALYDAAIGRWPAAVEVWASGLRATARIPGPAARARWLERMQAVALSVEALRQLVVHRDVAADGLAQVQIAELLCRRPGANRVDWLQWITVGGQAARRRLSAGLPALLERLAIEALPQLTSSDRPILIATLLDAGLHVRAAGLLAPLLAERPDDPRLLALHAECLRQTGDAGGAVAAAQRAFAAITAAPGATAAVTDVAAVDALQALVERWSSAWPEGAAPLRPRLSAARDPRRALPRQEVLALLEASAPPPAASAHLQRYLTEAAARADAGDGGAAAELERLGVAMARRALQGAWQRPIAEAMGRLCQVVDSDAEVCAHAAWLILRQQRLGEATAQWHRAVQIARRTGQPLPNPLAMIAEGDALDGRDIGAWLQLTDLQSASNQRDALRIANALLRAGRLLAARGWTEQALALASGRAVLTAVLPAAGQDAVAAADAQIGDPALLHLARAGASDVVLRHLPALASGAEARREAQVAFRYGRVELVALAQLGRQDEAVRKLDWLLTRPGVEPPRRAELLATAAQLGLCAPLLDAAIEEAAGRWLQVRPTVQAAVACAQQAGDGVRLTVLADRIQRSHIEVQVQLEFAQLLGRHGADGLAAAWYQRLLGPKGSHAAPTFLIGWAESLLRLKRPDDADEVLAQMAERSRGHALAVVTMMASKVLIAYERHEAALRLVDRALQQVDLPDLHHQRLEALVRLGDAARLSDGLERAARVGLDGGSLAQLLDIARAVGTLPALYQALAGLRDPDRDLERLRIRAAAAVGDVTALEAAVRQLRSRGGQTPVVAVRALADAGRHRDARALAEQLVAGEDGALARSDDEVQAMEAAIAVRRDPTSVAEALAIARLALARSNAPAAVALHVADSLRLAGAGAPAVALAGFAVDRHGDDPRVLARAAAIAELAGMPAAAAPWWRRAATATWTDPDRTGSHGAAGLPEALVELLTHLGDAGASEALRRWLPRWLDRLPASSVLWGEWLRSEAHANRPARCLRVLGLADAALERWPAKDLRDALAVALRSGLGPLLVEAYVAGRAPQRSEAWWLAAVLGALWDHGQGLDRVVAARHEHELTTALQASPLGRAALAQALAARGRALQAAQARGPSPFAGVGHGVGPGSADAEASAQLASAAAGVLAGLRSEPATPPSVSGTQHAPDAAAAAEATLRRWLKGLAVRHALALTQQLVEVGQADLARFAADMAWPNGRPFAVEAGDALAALRAHAGLGDDDATLAVAWRVADAPAHDGGQANRSARRYELALRLQAMGAPHAAAKLIEGDGRSGRLASPWIAEGEEGLDIAGGAVERFDPAALATKGPAAVGPGRSLRRLMALALAAGQPALAESVARASLAGHDEPWHRLRELIEESLRWGQVDLARTLLRSAPAEAPSQVFACARLAVGAAAPMGTAEVASAEPGSGVTPVAAPAQPDADPLNACVAGRSLHALSYDELAAIASALLRGEISVDALLERALVGATAMLIRRLLSVLAAEVVVADAEGRGRASALVQRLVERLPAEARRRSAEASLDELAALGVPELGLKDTAQALATAPKDYGALNNHAYARLLAGDSPAAVEPMARRAMAHIGGANGHALLDTLGAIAVAKGDLVAAERWQRQSLAANPRAHDVGLPQVRLAEILLRRGQRQQAREVAAWALQRGLAAPYYQARARAVIAASLRTATPG